MKTLIFIGDVVAPSGCGFLGKRLPELKKRYHADIVAVNAENSAKGNGVTRISAESVLRAGADILTTGNHAFRRWDSYDIYDESWIIRPANYPEGAPGRGYTVLDMGAYSCAFINLMGTAFMEPLDNPFTVIDRILPEIDTPNIFLDFHAEATSEKKAMGYYLAGRVSGVFGTHTHVQTADEAILSGHTAYITDVGMTGPEHSCLGVDTQSAIDKQRFHMPARFKEADGACFICGVCVEFDEKTGKSHKIERLIIR
ncbi:MAG: YmdB family metallophosphoesterase [Ruminococcus sp.]|nr:YmdB family metallophosphoesterase [Ruminococcus sp.]